MRLPRVHLWLRLCQPVAGDHHDARVVRRRDNLVEQYSHSV